MKKETALTDYIYINAERLDAYFEQISSPVFYDKVPTIDISLSLAGPKVAGKQERNPRSLTTHEKIAKLEAHLTKHNQVVVDRCPFTGASERTPFVLTTLWAKKIFIPPKSVTAETPEWFKGMAFWISTRRMPNWSVKYGRIFLLEDALLEDGYESMSSYSALALLSYEFDAFSQGSFTTAEGLDGALTNEDEQAVEFSLNPLNSLAKIGAKVFPEERFIKSLFSVRKYFLEPVEVSETANDWRPNLIGYPVYIAAGSRILIQ